MYLIQDTTRYNGDFLYWWAYGNDGYTTDIGEARRFTVNEANAIVKKSDGRFVKWPKDVVIRKSILAYNQELADEIRT